MEDRETPRMRKYGEWKTTRIMMATVPHVTAWAERTKYDADGFLFDWVYKKLWTGSENLTPTGFRSPDRPDRSQSLYRPRYPTPLHHVSW